MISTKTNRRAGDAAVQGDCVSCDASNTPTIAPAQAVSCDYVLAALRAASLRTRLLVADLDMMGIGLRDGWVTPEGALLWARDLGVLDLVGQDVVEDAAAELMGAAP